MDRRARCANTSSRAPRDPQRPRLNLTVVAAREATLSPNAARRALAATGTVERRSPLHAYPVWGKMKKKDMGWRDLESDDEPKRWIGLELGLDAEAYGARQPGLQMQAGRPRLMRMMAGEWPL